MYELLVGTMVDVCLSMKMAMSQIYDSVDVGESGDGDGCGFCGMHRAVFVTLERRTFGLHHARRMEER